MSLIQADKYRLCLHAIIEIVLIPGFLPLHYYP